MIAFISLVLSLCALGAFFMIAPQASAESRNTIATENSVAYRIAIGAVCILLLILALFPGPAQAANVATLIFPPVTEYTDGTPIPASKAITYDVYQGLKGATKVKVGTIVSGGELTTGLLTGNEYCWHVVAVIAADSQQSEPSNEGCKNFAGVPQSVVITVT